MTVRFSWPEGSATDQYHGRARNSMIRTAYLRLGSYRPGRRRRKWVGRRSSSSSRPWRCWALCGSAVAAWSGSGAAARYGLTEALALPHIWQTKASPMARSQAGRRVDWFAAGLGMVLAVVIQLVGGTLLFGSHRGQLVSQGLLTFAALLAGGTLAGFIGPAGGAVWNGVIVAVGFIIVEELAGAVGPTGARGLGGRGTA